jgi:hypothetical protein
MTEISSENKDQIIINKTKINKIPKENIFNSKDEEISIDEKEDSEIKIKYKSSIESSSNSSCSENHKSINQNILNESSYIFIDKKYEDYQEINYFSCNEKYLKEKMPEGNNYKKKSRNYLPKKECNFKRMSIDDLDLNKINGILKDIEALEDEKDEEGNNKINNDIKDLNIENLELNKFTPTKEPLNIDNTFLCSYINNYKFDCKFLIYKLFHFIFS